MPESLRALELLVDLVVQVAVVEEPRLGVDQRFDQVLVRLAGVNVGEQSLGEEELALFVLTFALVLTTVRKLLQRWRKQSSDVFVSEV